MSIDPRSFASVIRSFAVLVAVLTPLTTTTTAESPVAQEPGVGQQIAPVPPSDAEGATDVAATLLPHVYPVARAAAGFEGPALDWIVDNAADVQFVMFGEQHGIDPVPRFVASAYERLRPQGFDHLALETGPWIAATLSTMPTDEVVARYPYSITFDYDAEIDLLRAAQRLGDPAVGPRIWGIDQVITAIHPLEQLVAIAPSADAARTARGLLLKAAFKAGSFLRQGHFDDVERLRAAFDPPPGSEAELIIDGIERSMRIFTLYRQERINDSVQMRETYMAELFTRQLEESTASPTPTGAGSPPASSSPGGAAAPPRPRTVFKMGGAHVVEGLEPNGIPSFGDFVARYAADNGTDALHIGIRSYIADDFGLPPELIEGHEGILIDYRALRPLLEAGELGTLSAGRADDIRGYDAAIFLRAGGTAPKAEILAAEAAWRSDTLARIVGPIGGCLLILLTALLWPIAAAIRALLRRRQEQSDASRPALAYLTASLYALAATGLIGWQVAVLLRDPLAAPIGFQPADLGILPRAVLVLGGVAMVTFAVLAWRRRSWGMVARLHYALMSLAAVGLLVLTWMWDLPTIPG